MAESENGVTQLQLQHGVCDDGAPSVVRDIDAVGRNRLALSQIGIAWTESAALRTVVQLDVPRILAKQAAPPHHAMSAQQLLQHMPGASHPNAGALQHLLQLLACKGLFTEHSLEYHNPPGVSGDQPGGSVVKMYALNSVSRQLVGDNPRDSMANFALQMTMGPHVAATLQHLGEAILTSADPFRLAHGVNYFEYLAKHPEYLNVFQNAMAERSQAETGPLLLSRYKGFDSVKGLMDVGGGTGAILAQIVHHYPHITHAVNFDLPEVVALSPDHPGVEHVGGDMFESIPTGCDAIFMKKLLHDWDDEACIKILKKCYDALPETGGKVILVEGVLSPKETPGNTNAKSNTVEDEFVLRSSVIMFVHCVGGKERSEQDFQRLVAAAGFHNFQLSCKLDVSYVMEAHK